MIRVDYDDEPLAVLILRPRIVGWTAELRPLAGQPGVPRGNRWRLTRYAAMAAALEAADALDPTETFVHRRLAAGLFDALDRALVHGTGTGPGPQGIRTHG